MARLAILFLLVTWSMSFGSPPASRYELIAKVTQPSPSSVTEISKSPLSSGVETTYSYYEIHPDGSKTLRWRRTEPGEYEKHWISPSGRVWIMSGQGTRGIVYRSTYGPGSISLRDLDGDVLGKWQGWQNSGKRVFKGSRPKPAPPTVLVPGKVQARVLRPDVAEQLVLPFDNGASAHLTVFWPKGRNQPVLAQQMIAKGGHPSLLEKALVDPAYDLPVIERPFGARTALSFWRAKALDPRRRDLVAMVTRWYSSTTQPLSLDEELPLDHYPDSISIIPSGLALFFDFFGNTARMTFRDLEGRPVHTTDLVKLGHFANAAEAKSSLDWKSPRILAGGGWTPIGQADPYQGGGQQMELWDKKGRRFLFTIKRNPNSVKEEVLTGYAARRPIEMYGAYGSKPLEERSVLSRNGRYKLRVRTFAAPQGPSPRAITLLARVPEAGKTAEVELWTAPSYQDIPYMGVTDSGRAVYLEIGRTKAYGQNDSIGHMTDYAAFRIWGPGKEGIGGEDPLGGWGFKTAADLRKAVKFSEIKLESIGRAEQTESQGLPVPAWPVERITIPMKSGPPRILYILRHTGMGDNILANDQPWVRQMVQRAVSEQGSKGQGN